MSDIPRLTNLMVTDDARVQRTTEEKEMALVALDNHYCLTYPNGRRPMVGCRHLRSGNRLADLVNVAAPQKQILRINQ